MHYIYIYKRCERKKDLPFLHGLDKHSLISNSQLGPEKPG